MNSITSKFGLTRITSNTKYEAENFEGVSLFVEGKDTTLEFENSQLVRLRGAFRNCGRVFFTTTAAALEDHRHWVNFMAEAFYNEGLLVVRHEKAGLPIHVAFGGRERPDYIGFGVWYSENLGTMIVLSNHEGDARTKQPNLRFRIHQKFINLGSISVLGTKKLAAILRMEEIKMRALFVNTGTIYLKHAGLAQTANLEGDGCIVIGEKSWIFTHMNYTVGGQRLHFAAGSKGLEIKVTSDEFDRIHYITNFPRGTCVFLTGGFGPWRVEGSDFIVTNKLGRENLTIRFLGFTLDKTRVYVTGSQMMYREDLVRSIPDSRCAKIDLVMAEASEYEIDPQ